MGEFRFRVPAGWELPAPVAATTHVIGLDGIPWPCKVRRDGDVLVVSRNRDESGRTYLGYPVSQYGRMILCTGSLLPGEHVYDLFTELARGTLNRVRNQISIWEEGGLEISADVQAAITSSTKALGQALMSDDPNQRDQLAQQAIDAVAGAIFEISRSFGQQVSGYRREHREVDNFWIAVPESSDEPEQPAVQFDRSVVSLQQIEQSDVNGRADRFVAKQPAPIVGPFLDASAGGLSEALIRADDFRARRQQVLANLRQTFDRLPDGTSLLHLVSGINGLGHRHLNYAQQLQLALEMLNLVDEFDGSMPTLVSFDFPWAERLAGAVGGIHPLQVADSLLRQGARVSYLGLDINLDYGVTGSAVRDPLQWIDLADTWAQLGLPLVLCLRIPSGVTTEISNAAPQDRLVSVPGQELSDLQRFEVLRTVLPLLAARPAVAGVIWRQRGDADDRRFPFGGLFDEAGNEKPVQGVLQSLRQG